MKRIFVAAILLIMAALPASAGSGPSWSFGYVPSPAEWQFWWTKKYDDPGVTLCPVTGCLFTGAIGYLTGSGTGGAIAQTTSRTTGVTLNTITGAITLFSAAGSATATTFTVTNSTIAATDTVIVNQKKGTGTNIYEIFPSPGAGSFDVTFLTTGGTATDAPVFNFNIIKGSAN